ncbi:NAD(P)H-dependent glycerol-3-phosphate dehydrogenase [Anderseniella sp. Alg231-50]|uniref:NAD(P)H-dependent glycerol-3-phosphate dehydrogenase n=1 Tax=Anderseniella sp. Alg231-50 TaxID=1922226 RepID=UPI000D54D4AA
MTTKQFSTAWVIGAGAWGTALATMCVRAGLQTTLWCRSAELADAITADRENKNYLPGHHLPDELLVTADLSGVTGGELLILATPAQATREVVAKLRRHISEPAPLIVTAKGLERDSNKFLTDVVQEGSGLQPFVLSGPSFAADVVAGLPTAITLAGEDTRQTSAIAHALSTRSFRIYVSADMKGVQIGGAVKNVLAIAVGICAGKGLGASAQAALLARSFAELRRLAEALGAQSETLFGLSGLGDLVLTSSSTQSRNFSLGVELGKGVDLQTILASRTAVSEGVHTAGVVCAIAAAHNIEMPVCEAVARIVSGSANVDDEIIQLMSRPLRAEHD